LPMKRARNLDHHPVRLDEREPEAARGVGIVGAVQLVLVERDGVDHLGRAGEQTDLHAELVKRRRRGRIEARHRPGLEGDALVMAVGRSQIEDVIHEVELDLQPAAAGVHERGGESPARDIEGYLPPVVDHRREAETNLADDLRP
jgi:hypothetical protein